MSNKAVLVNVTAAQHGGAMSILLQFIRAFAERKPQGIQLYVFCSVPVDNLGCEAISMIQTPPKSMLQRLLWDYRGIRKWAEAEGVEPSLIFSLQNTGVWFRRVPQLVYLHQAIPFSARKWSVFKKNERSLWFYKHIYPFFIRISLSRHSHLVVQTRWMKESAAARFHFPPDKITVARPEGHPIPAVHLDPLPEPERCHFFYPANPAIFKNHLVLIQAAAVLKKQASTPPFKIHFTCRLEELTDECKMNMDKYNLYDNFAFHDKLPFSLVARYYLNAKALLFPSTIETVGLPLLEAASCGMPVIAADEPYAKEALAGYDNVRWAPAGMPDKWAGRMLEIMNNSKRSLPAARSLSGEWGKVIDLIEELAKH